MRGMLCLVMSLVFRNNTYLKNSPLVLLIFRLKLVDFSTYCVRWIVLLGLMMPFLLGLMFFPPEVLVLRKLGNAVVVVGLQRW